MKKITAVIGVLGLVFMLGACGQKGEKTGMANPNKYDIGKDEMVGITGIEITAPEDAEEVQYSVIGYESDKPMSEVTFKIDGREYCYRAQVADSKIPLGDSLSLMSEENFECANISGIYTKWNTMAIFENERIDGVLATDNANTLLIWNDAVSGIMYNLSVDKKLSVDEQSQLLELADSVYVSLQGECE